MDEELARKIEGFHDANPERNSLDHDNPLAKAFIDHYKDHKGSKYLWKLPSYDMMDLPERCRDGKRILNIGGGTSLRMGDNENGTFDPHLSHFLTDLGAIVTNVDIFPEYADVPYEHVVADLTRTRLPELLNGREYDIAIATSFFDSPQLYAHSLRWERKFFRDVSKDVYTLLIPDGKYFISGCFFKDEETVNKIKTLEDIGYSVEIRGSFTKSQLKSMGLAGPEWIGLFESVCATKKRR